MKNILTIVPLVSLVGCATYQVDIHQVDIHQVDVRNASCDELCSGDADDPESVDAIVSMEVVENPYTQESFLMNFEVIEDKALLSAALGEPKKGKLSQGQAYKSKEDTQVTLYRAWNSTNPNSKFGKWWAFQKPEGEISEYRSDYEICYQWSPLDKLVTCTLKADTKVVIGTGQSAECSEYLTYPVSDELQIYLDDASASLSHCSTLNGEFNWQ